MDLFENKKILPMMLKQNSQPFDSDDYIFELKFDGIRCLAYLDKDTTILINRKLRNITNIFPELKNINKQIKEKCILDGELVYLDENGKPNFNILMTRNLSTNSFTINIKSKVCPVVLIVFDILYYVDKDITKYELLRRKKILKENIIENNFINISRYIENNGIALFNKVKEEKLEGIIAKLKKSSYQIGRRSGDWIKIKNLIDEDFIICGYTLDKDNRIKDLVLGQYDKTKLVFVDYLYLERKKQEEKYILNFAKNHSLNSPLFNQLENKNIHWIQPELVCTATYLLRTEKGNMRHPVFKTIREDKLPLEVFVNR